MALGYELILVFWGSETQPGRVGWVEAMSEVGSWGSGVYFHHGNKLNTGRGLRLEGMGPE